MIKVEWLVVLAAVACPLMMLGAGAIAWIAGKRAGSAPDRAATESEAWTESTTRS